MPPSRTDTVPTPPSADTIQGPPVPTYLSDDYWWAYVHPKAVRVFERDWLVNLILFGNYGRLRDLALANLRFTASGRTLQVACVYGNLTKKLMQRMPQGASLDVVDVLSVQLDNLARKLGTDPRVSLKRQDASALGGADARYDQALLFFLLHEQPEVPRRATIREALRVVRPGGRVVIVDYHRPWALHPLRPLVQLTFSRLEPFAKDLWNHAIEEFLPADIPLARVHRETYFGGLYQLVVLERG